MDARLQEEKVMDERLAVMPFVSADYGKMPSYAIFRVSNRRFKTVSSTKGFIKHINREKDTPNADPERMVNNEQIYGPEDIYEDTKEYLKDCKINKNSVIGRELLLTASPQFFKGMSKQEFEHWKNINIKWLQDTFKDNFRAAVLHMDETSPHIHALIIPKLWNERFKKYTLQNYQYFNGYQALRDLQDSYAEAMQKDFPVLKRGIVGSKAKHVSIQKLYTVMNETEKETNIESLQAKAANQELLKMKVNYLDKTLKSFQYFKRQDEEEKSKILEENQRLRKEIEELKKNISSKELKQENTQEKNKTVSRGFSGKRYNKSV